jgi:16S rRNA processing protein RimM
VALETPPPLLAVGRLARAHGIRGRVLVAPFNEHSDGLEKAKVLWLGKPGQGSSPLRRYDVAFAERVNLGYIFQLRGVDDRNTSETLRGMEVSVSRDELPELDEGELYAADLVGLTVFDANHPLPREPLGVVTALEQAGPNELLVLKLVSGEQALAPLNFVVEADVEKKSLLLAVPAGLFEAQLATAKAEPDEDVS